MEIMLQSISKKFQITKGAVSQVVNKLFEKGYLKKERKEGYLRKLRYHLAKRDGKPLNFWMKCTEKWKMNFSSI